MSKDSHSTTWYESLRIWDIFPWCLHLWPLENSQQLGWVKPLGLEGHWALAVGVWNRLEYAGWGWTWWSWKSFSTQTILWFMCGNSKLLLPSLSNTTFFSGLVMLLVLNTVPSFIPHTQMAFVGGDVADGYNNKKLLSVCWCFAGAGGLGWQILQQLCLVWTSPNKAKPITGYFFAVLGGNSSIQQSILLLFGIIFYL